MNREKSTHAIAALDELHSSRILNWVIRNSIHDPAMGGPENHPNARFFGDVEWYLTCRQITHAGDTLNTYCQKILAEILEADASAWDLVGSLLRAKNRESAIVNLRIQREIDSCVREGLREGLGALWSFEVEIVVELRNRIVHQNGYDPEGRIQDAMREFPPGRQFLPPADLEPGEPPFDLDGDGRLIIDARTGYWATRHVEHHIDLVDQALCHRFGLPRQRNRPRKKSFKYLDRMNDLTQPPGTPLPIPRAAAPSTQASPELPPPPDYTSMSDPEEKACAAIWNRVRAQIDSFVRKYCEEAGVTICGIDASIAGMLLPHTLEGHDQHLSYNLKPQDEPDTRAKYLGVRLRQQNRQPHITMWGTHSQMRDFRPCELTDEVREYLRDDIDHALTL